MSSVSTTDAARISATISPETQTTLTPLWISQDEDHPTNNSLQSKIDTLTNQLKNLSLEAPNSRLHACALYARKMAIIDFTYIIALHLIVWIAYRCMYRPLLHPETLHTIGQRKRAKEVDLIKNSLQSKKVVLTFCEQTGRYVDALVPSIIARKLNGVPKEAEAFFHYKLRTYFPYYLGYPLDYCLHQLDKRTAYRASAIASTFGRATNSYFCSVRTRLAYSLLDKNILNLWVNFEHLFLRIMLQAQAESINDGAKFQRRLNAGLESLALTLSQEAEIEKYFKGIGITQAADVIIARIEWHKSRGTLPPGLPDPTKESLTAQNLHEKLDSALNAYLGDLIEKLLTHKVPENFTKGLSGFVWWLEGKDLVKEILTFLASEYGIKQLVDPHLCTLAMLTAFGVETLELELDGFGRKSKATILTSGQKMLTESLKLGATSQAILLPFVQSGLRHNPGNTEGFHQRREAKERLKFIIAKLIHDLKDTEHRQTHSFFKQAREKASQMPVIGLATITLHTLVSGTIFSLNYLLRDENQPQTTFVEWMSKNFLGQKFADFVAERIVALIYHPCWRITLLHLIEALIKTFTEPQQTLAVPEANRSFQHFKQIASFLFDHFTKDSSSLISSLGEGAKRFSSESTFAQFQQLFKPRQGSMIEKCLAPLVPTIKELSLFTRLTDSFRCQGIHFAGDDKFWEYYIREYLNRYVAQTTSERYQSSKNGPSQNDRVAIREEHVDYLLSLDLPLLRKRLAEVAVLTPLSDTDDVWQVIDKAP